MPRCSTASTGRYRLIVMLDAFIVDAWVVWMSDLPRNPETISFLHDFAVGFLHKAYLSIFESIATTMQVSYRNTGTTMLDYTVPVAWCYLRIKAINTEAEENGTR